MDKNYRIVRSSDSSNPDAESIRMIDAEKNDIACMKLEYQKGGIVITYLEVSPQYRRMGYGTYLLQSFLDPVAESGEFVPVEAFIGNSDEAEGIQAFFEAQSNFTISEERNLYRVKAKDRRKNSRWQSLSSGQWDATEVFSKDLGFRNVVKKELYRTGFEDYMDKDELYDKRICFASKREDGGIGSVILFKKHSEKELELSLLYMAKNDKRALWNVVSAACNVIDELYPYAEIWFNASTPTAAALANGIFGNSARIGKTCIARWNGVGQEEQRDFRQMLTELGVRL